VVKVRGRMDECTVGRRHRGEFDVAQRADDPKPTGAHGLQMRAALNERHVVAGHRQPRAEIAADAAGADHRDFHRLSFFLNLSAAPTEQAAFHPRLDAPVP